MALPNSGTRLRFKAGNFNDYQNASKDNGTIYLIEKDSTYSFYVGENPITGEIPIDTEITQYSSNAATSSAIFNFVQNRIGSAIEVDYAGEGIGTDNASDSASALKAHFRYYDDGSLKFKYGDSADSIYKLQKEIFAGDGLELDDNVLNLKLQTGEGLSITNSDGAYKINIDSSNLIKASSTSEQTINSDVKISKNLAVQSLSTADVDSDVITIESNVDITGTLEAAILNTPSLVVTGSSSLKDTTMTSAVIESGLTNSGVFTTTASPTEPKITLTEKAVLEFGGSYSLDASKALLPTITAPSATINGALTSNSFSATTGTLSDSLTIGKITFSTNTIDVEPVDQTKELQLNASLNILNNLDVTGSIAASSISASASIEANTLSAIASISSPKLVLNSTELTTIVEGNTSDGQSGYLVTGVAKRLTVGGNILLTANDVIESDGLVYTRIKSLSDNISDVSSVASSAASVAGANTTAIGEEITRAQQAEQANAAQIAAVAAALGAFLHVGDTEPTSTTNTKLWIHTGFENGMNVMKYHNGTNWVALNAVWG